ncbi:Metallo-beta-lactamase superfamily [Cedecea neteri]|uniref:Metallo-beta-lactamase superfamily n=1 Tax=Cedecea neteri TaxID=158822 RepID=A0A2X3JCH1_9ENTR|nr:Metallo-beta-lactamase superfamily [Cedecea neteri]
MIKKLLVSALFAASYSAFALADNAGAAFKTFPLGKLELTALHDKNNALPNDGKVMGVDVGEKAVAEVLSAAGAPTDNIKLSVDALLVKDGSKVILLDTGLGPNAQGQLISSLAKSGYKPEQITDVLITHVSRRPCWWAAHRRRQTGIPPGHGANLCPGLGLAANVAQDEGAGGSYPAAGENL